jgi:hypothetical protein
VELKSLVLRVDILNIGIAAIGLRLVELGLCVSVSELPPPSILCILTAAGASILTMADSMYSSCCERF